MTNDGRKNRKQLTGEHEDRDRDRLTFGKTPQSGEERGKNPKPMATRPATPPKPPEDGGSGISMKGQASAPDNGKR